MYLQTLDATEKKLMVDQSVDEISMAAIKDHRFWARVMSFPFTGDQVQIDHMRKLIHNVELEYTNSVQYQFGLGPEQTSPWAWVTYQFTHYSFMHLFGNLIFIFLIILYLQKTIDPFMIVSVYLLGGIGGGISFLMMNTDGNLSVIGASGSLCALMAFLVIVKKNELMPWTYFFAPVPNGYGVIYMPAFLIFPIFLVTDFTSVLWSADGVLSSTAHSAHVGGTITGLCMGFGYLLHSFFRREATSHRIFSYDYWFDKLL
jgi:membrane associated rhomboid family serine protease